MLTVMMAQKFTINANAEEIICKEYVAILALFLSLYCSFVKENRVSTRVRSNKHRLDLDLRWNEDYKFS